MILLDNYSKINTFINITADGYCIIDAKNVEGIENGEGGFSEDGELLGLYIDDGKLYFQYNNKSYETKPNEIKCTNEILKDCNRNFIVKINEVIVCNKVYKPYVNPLALIFGDDEDEFDFLLHLSKLMKSEDSILNFIKGINNLNKYYCNNN